uniref:Uncharacterized protein n=1 Tax=Pithovirus LCDPAC02 TaxID=2506601 RepID=A0A481YR16_9VIRU|nr:MAG: hypothetical protein LCDPAC02_03740 [Pithovirus LCDPAC02]
MFKPYCKNVKIDEKTINYGDWDDPIEAKGYVNANIFRIMKIDHKFLKNGNKKA